MTRLLGEYRGLLLSALRDVLAASSTLSLLVRQHVGVEDEQGRPIDAAGKLLRPALVLFAAREFGGEIEPALPAAVALELVHNFSLVHDDIQDRDRTRRGRPTLWVAHGEAEAINAGDLLHAMAAREVARCGAAAASCLAQATVEMIEGQSLDLSYEGRFVAIDEYLAMIDRKTGALLRCSLELGGIVAGASDEALAALRELGIGLGRAFQIRDDVLGIWGDGDVVGKPQGSDVRRRKKAFPAVWAHAHAGQSDRRRLEAVYSGGEAGDNAVVWVVALMERVGAREAADAAVRDHLARGTRSLDRLPLSPAGRDELDELIRYLAGRTR